MDEHISELAASLKSKLKITFISFIFDFCSEITDQSFTKLAESLGTLINLHALDLRTVSLSKCTILSLNTLLKNLVGLPRLAEFGFDANGFGINQEDRIDSDLLNADPSTLF